MQLANLLLVEDNDDDAILFKYFCDEHRICNKITRVRTAAEAKERIEEGGEYQFVVVDISLPSNGGFDFIYWLKKQPNYENVSIMVLSGSEAEADVMEAQRLNVCVYMSKPLVVEKWWELIKVLKHLHIGLMFRKAA
jgi:two-component system response regulator